MATLPTISAQTPVSGPAGTPVVGAADVQPADLAQAGHDIRLLVASAPERLLWVPGRALWGLALLQGSDRVILAIDGCLAIAMTCWPSHFVPGGVYPLAGVARAVKRGLPIKRLGGQSWFACALPPARCGACCVIITHQELGWLRADDPPLTPLDEVGTWTAPSDPAAVSPPGEWHPWLGIAALRPPEPTPERFVSTIGEPLECRLLPDRWRAEQLRCEWMRHHHHERERARLAGHALPAWLEDDHGCDHLVAAWLAGWRGPSPPVLEPAGPRPAGSLELASAGQPTDDAGTERGGAAAAAAAVQETGPGLPAAARPFDGPGVSWR